MEGCVVVKYKSKLYNADKINNFRELVDRYVAL